MAAAVLLGILSARAPRAAAHQTFLALIPNAEDYPQVTALGHVNKNGGGPLNVFGEAFRDHKFTWSLEMCLGDADGDGATNGMELGDACCTWKEGDRAPRSWGLSHPGDPDDTCTIVDHRVDSAALLKGVEGLRSFDDLKALLAVQGLDCGAASLGASGVGMTPQTQAERDAEFWKFYFKGSAEAAPPVTLGAALLDVAATVGYPVLHPISFVSWVVQTFVGTIVAFFNALTGGGGLYKHGQKIFSLVCVVMTVNVMRAGGAKDIWHSTRGEKVTIAFCCVLWVEFISGLLHITLDNPAFQHTPFIGAMARDFQWHHKKPTHICNMSWTKFLGAIDAGVIVLFLTAHYWRRKHRWMRMFTLCAFPFLYLMMASHRWSHIRRDDLPPLVAFLQSHGILLSQEVHSIHHANYDQNFSLMTGWSNPFINWACIHIMGPKNTTWAYIFCVWALVPVWLPLLVDSKRFQVRSTVQHRLGLVLADLSSFKFESSHIFLRQ